MILLLLFIGIGLLFYISLASNSYLVKSICLILMAPLLLLAMRFSKGKTLLILRRYMIEYDLICQ